MAKKSSRGAWKILRVAILLWARKGGAWKRRAMMDLHLFLKSSVCRSSSSSYTSPRRGYYFERELSFDKTPMFSNLKTQGSAGSMRFLMLPCLGGGGGQSQVDFDYEYEYDYDPVKVDHQVQNVVVSKEEEEEEEEGIDLRAEEFINKFYAQMKLQRQISYLQYKETTETQTISS
ncbi:hypothetical protein ACFE04_018247 [Oxalis oulophora]